MSNSCIIKFDNGRKTYLFFFLGNTNFQKLITFHNSKTPLLYSNAGPPDQLTFYLYIQFVMVANIIFVIANKVKSTDNKNKPIVKFTTLANTDVFFTVSCNIFV